MVNQSSYLIELTMEQQIIHVGKLCGENDESQTLRLPTHTEDKIYFNNFRKFVCVFPWIRKNVHRWNALSQQSFWARVILSQRNWIQFIFLREFSDKTWVQWIRKWKVQWNPECIRLIFSLRNIIEVQDIREHLVEIKAKSLYHYYTLKLVKKIFLLANPDSVSPPTIWLTLLFYSFKPYSSWE